MPSQVLYEVTGGSRCLAVNAIANKKSYVLMLNVALNTSKLMQFDFDTNKYYIKSSSATFKSEILDKMTNFLQADTTEINLITDARFIDKTLHESEFFISAVLNLTLGTEDVP